VEATRDDDADKNRLCPPTPLPDTPTDWCLMQVLGTRATTSFGAEPDIKAWADRVALNPARMPPDQVNRAELTAAVARFRTHADAGLSRLTQLAGLS
jgi:hypothetical protein